MGKVIFLSPHLDDAVFSCAGLIQECVQQSNDVDIVTVFSAGANERIAEDLKATRILGCNSRLLNFQDAPVRRCSPDVLFQNISDDSVTLDDLTHTFIRMKNEAPANTRFYAPLGIGWHVDHIITFEAAIKAFPNSNLEFYEDSPYSAVKYQTDLRISSQNDKRQAVFIQDFFKAKYVQTYLSEWTPQILAKKMKDYPQLALALPVQQTREVVLSKSMMNHSHIAKTQYNSQSAFYSKNAQGNIERYYRVSPPKKTSKD